jgi:hypothetical protein
MRILTINPRYPGATGDAFIWRNSACKRELARRYADGERGEWLIGMFDIVSLSSNSWNYMIIPN